MVLKHRHGWGYRSRVAEVSDSIHLRRFCRIALTDRVADESWTPRRIQDMTYPGYREHDVRADVHGSG